MENPHGRDISHIKLTAALAVILLVGIGAWQAYGTFYKKAPAGPIAVAPAQGSGAQNAPVASSTPDSTGGEDAISAVSTDAMGEIVGAYTGLQENGEYSTSTATQIAGNIGLGLAAPVTYTPIDASDVRTSTSTSYSAMLQYRASLQTTLKPLLSNTQPEYGLFGMYVETKQQTYLDQLTAAAANYTAAASSTAALTVPADAVSVQIGLVNSMNEFATTLNDLVAHASDPVASTVLLENYNQAENDVLTAFQNLVTYEQSKTQ